MKNTFTLLISLFFVTSYFNATAQTSFPCSPASAQVDLDINNVRARILNGGDMWWNLSQQPGYEVPKGSGIHTSIASAFWIGGIDDDGQLHTAAQIYRQYGHDFWPGPIDTTTSSTVDSICNKYDKIWKVNKAEVSQFIVCRNLPGYVIPDDIKTWPGNGNTAAGYSASLAPFIDVDSDGIYNSEAGDYPAFSFDNTLNNCNYHLQGDQCLWWVFNDKGNTHTAINGGLALGIEVQVSAFAFRTNDEINDATFYRHKIINRSSNRYSQTWIGRFTDAELGGFSDDYVGCDVTRGMGYIYNGQQYDGGSAQAFPGIYAANPPAFGIDYVQGPVADDNDFVDNDRDQITDEPDERIAMSMFRWHTEDPSTWNSPSTSSECYYYMKGFWSNNVPMTYGMPSGFGGTVPCMYMFPGDSDPLGYGTGGIPQAAWTELTVGNFYFDRIMLMSAGPFTLEPGEVEVIVESVCWARDTNNFPNSHLLAIDHLGVANNKAQLLFDACFDIPCTQQGDPEILFTQNNSNYWFYSTGNANGWIWDFGDGTGSSAQFPNHQYAQSGTYNVCLQQLTSCGTKNICKEIRIDINDPAGCGPELVRLEGQGCGTQELWLTSGTVLEILNSPDHRSLHPKYQSLHGPVRVSYENYSNLIDGEYRIAFDSTHNAARWKMWRIGSTDTVYADSTIGTRNRQIIAQWGLAVEAEQIVPPGSPGHPLKNGVISASLLYKDPSKNWLSSIYDNDEDPGKSDWILSGDRIIDNNCQVILSDQQIQTAFIDPYANFEKLLNGSWAPYRLGALTPLPAATTICREAGVRYSAPAASMPLMSDLAGVDIIITTDKSLWSRCVVFESGPVKSLNQGQQEAFLMRDHASVDKDGRTVAEGGLSDVNNPEAADYIAGQGMGWFPGYAVNTETGERLNISFAENSSLAAENGNDMRWNPTSAIQTNFGYLLWGGMHTIYVFGHNGDAIYPANFATPDLRNQRSDVDLYDMGKSIYRILISAASAAERKEVFRDAMWVNIPLLNPGHSLFETDVKISLRVTKPYAKYATSSAPENKDFPLYGFSIVKNEICCNIYDQEVIVFPNPFRDEFTIRFDNRDELLYTFRLYNMAGQLVRETTTNKDKVFVPGAVLESGVYIWSLSNGNEKRFSGKVIKY